MNNIREGKHLNVHINPNCKDDRFCLSHNEFQAVSYDAPKMLEYIHELETYINKVREDTLRSFVNYYWNTKFEEDIEPKEIAEQFLQSIKEQDEKNNQTITGGLLMTFNEFLTNKYIEQEHPLDDMIPDGFNDWLISQDPQDLIDYAEEWKTEMVEGELEDFLEFISNKESIFEDDFCSQIYEYRTQYLNYKRIRNETK